MTSARLTPTRMRRGVAELSAAHPPFAAVVERHGPPPMWTRRPGYATLWSSWAPPAERSRLSSIPQLGGYVGARTGPRGPPTACGPRES